MTVSVRHKSRQAVAQKVLLWNAAKGESVREYKHLPDQMKKIALTADGTGIATLGESENRIRFWDLAGGPERYPAPDGHSGSVFALMFSPDGRVLASGAGDHTLRFWNVATRKQELVLQPLHI